MSPAARGRNRPVHAIALTGKIERRAARNRMFSIIAHLAEAHSSGGGGDG